MSHLEEVVGIGTGLKEFQLGPPATGSRIGMSSLSEFVVVMAYGYASSSLNALHGREMGRLCSPI